MNLEPYHAIDCTEGQEWTEKEKNFFIICAWGRRRQQIEEFAEAVVHVRNAGKETQDQVQAVLSHSICNSHRAVMDEEIREFKSRSRLDQEVV
jgi:hypothetical protein